MSVSITELCQELRNWFCFDEDKHIENFTIADGIISPSIDIQDSQFFRVVGSVFNDGVHKSTDELINESFHGGIWLMRVPPEVVSLLSEINDYEAKYGAINLSPYSSESFGGYSYTKTATGFGDNGGNTVINWRDVFKSRLNKWRKIR